MKFSDREDIEAPIEHVHRHITDFAMFERQALRRGADVKRVDGEGPVAVGSAWDVVFSFRGKQRKLRATVAALDDQTVQVDSASAGLEGVTLIELVPLSPRRTRMSMSIDLSAKTLTARLLLQSLKLAKANLTMRFKKRVGEYAQEIEDRYKRSA